MLLLTLFVVHLSSMLWDFLAADFEEVLALDATLYQDSVGEYQVCVS